MTHQSEGAMPDILRDITEADTPARPARPTPHPFSRHCACADCMRAYLMSVEPLRGAA